MGSDVPTYEPRDPTVEDHQDDSYGSCVICHWYRPHTDGEFNLVPYPCAVARERDAARSAASPSSGPDPDCHRCACQAIGIPCALPHTCNLDSGFVKCPLCGDPERVEDVVGGVCLACADAIAFSQHARRASVKVPSYRAED